MHTSPVLRRPPSVPCSPLWVAPAAATTPPTPSNPDRSPTLSVVSPIPSENRPIQTPAFFTPANACAHISPPSYLRRESLDVPASCNLTRLSQGSGVTVYKMERSPTRDGVPRSPWVIKKADISPLIAHELRRVERTLEYESRLLSEISHPNIVGFRAAQRAPDGQLILALEACDCSLYSLIQERQFHRIQAGDLGRSRPLFSPNEILTVVCGVASALHHLHTEHKILHGDIKSANILLSLRASNLSHACIRSPCNLPLAVVKVCDLGVALPLVEDLSAVAEPDRNVYLGTESWRPPEARGCKCSRVQINNDSACRIGMSMSNDAGCCEERPRRFQICDRSDVYCLGLVIWEMLTGDVPTQGRKSSCSLDECLSLLETRPTLECNGELLGKLHPEYDKCIEAFEWCTERDADARPSAQTLEEWLRLLIEDAFSGASDAR